MTPKALIAWIRRRPVGHVPPTRREGRYLRFIDGPIIAHQTSYAVISRRGAFAMGRIEWSPQWRAWMFRAAGEYGESVYPLSALAEIHAFMRDLGGRQV
jgi:hypothetical protein